MTGYFSAEERILLRGEKCQRESGVSLSGWYPVVARQDSIWWRFFGEKRFSEPFFQDTLSSLDQRFCLQTDFDALEEFGDALEPSALIFHVSRCGSTLLTQLLSALPHCLAMSEPPIIDSCLHLQPDEAERALKGVVAALGQKRFREEEHFFLKLDSWHIASLPLFRRAFPDVPFLFLYRKPDEVLASHRRRRGGQMVPGMPNHSMSEIAHHPPGDLDGFCVKMLERFFSAACDLADELVLFNYAQLPQAAWSELLDMFVISATPAQIAAMQVRSGMHAKSAEKFEVREADDPAAGPVYAYYDRLERLRLAR